MSNNYIISIGRQLGAGGAQMGKMLADYYGFEYIDREILVLAAKQMNISESALAGMEEKGLSVWNSFAQVNMYDVRVPEEWYMPTGRKVYETQTKILQKAASEHSCVIVGRCASHIFKDQKNSMSIFLHADMNTRKERLLASGKLDLFGKDAEKAIIREDRERAQYFNTYTGAKWSDLTSYDLTLDTGKMSLEQCRDAIVQYISIRFPELADI